jgi:hypothetical protein
VHARLSRLAGLPGLQNRILALRLGLIWLMLTVVLGPRATRALAQGAAVADPDAASPQAAATTRRPESAGGDAVRDRHPDRSGRDSRPGAPAER